MLIYCAHKYGGDPANKDKVEEIISELQLCDSENTYISPIHTFGYLYDDVTYEDGMELCYDLLNACDKLLVLSEPSTGVLLEIDKAHELHIPIEFYT